MGRDISRMNNQREFMPKVGRNFSPPMSSVMKLPTGTYLNELGNSIIHIVSIKSLVDNDKRYYDTLTTKNDRGHAVEPNTQSKALAPALTKISIDLFSFH